MGVVSPGGGLAGLKGVNLLYALELRLILSALIIDTELFLFRLTLIKCKKTIKLMTVGI
jgi:hypothetical protein